MTTVRFLTSDAGLLVFFARRKAYIMRRYLGAILLSGFLLSPAIAMADDHHDSRYYDRDRRDYHEWNEREQRAYRHWLEQERHRTYHDWERASARERREYWRWRHAHPDRDDR